MRNTAVPKIGAIHIAPGSAGGAYPISCARMCLQIRMRIVSPSEIQNFRRNIAAL